MNVIVITGNMVADPEMRTTSKGDIWCRFSVAVNRRYSKHETDFFSCVAWREQAEFICKYFKKGQRIELSGSMLCRKYEDRDGNTRSSWELNLNGVGFAGGKKGDTEEVAGEESRHPSAVSPDEYKAANFEELAGDEELPF